MRHLISAQPTRLELIALAASSFDGSPRHVVHDDPRIAEHRDVVRHALSDSERTDPEHVWGDEGPVTG